ncbi:MAG: hypothetical protein VXX11_03510 [Planctomycetota bacterium]|nr:hypothetical protein [Planctomycetota bacterium]
MDRHLQAIILRQRGQNGPLVAELLEKLTPQSKERLYRILSDMEQQTASAKRKAKQPWMRP